MPFVHSLVITQANGKKGWCAPVELGEDSPHYVSLVIPVDERRNVFNIYICETVTTTEHGHAIESHDLVKRGKNSFALQLGDTVFWFSLRPGSLSGRHLPYVGKLQHEDFTHLFIEIEPEEPESLDKLYDKHGTFVIGCEPFKHYGGVSAITSNR